MSRARYSYLQKRSKKAPLLALAAVLCAALLTGGTFAWKDFTQSYTNKFRGTFDADVTLHDEFDGVRKDIFVENSGTNTIYVRVRLDEYMQVDDRVFATGARAKDKSTWTTHLYSGASITNCGQADNGTFHSYYRWSMTGSARRYFPGTPGMVYTRLTGTDLVTGNPVVDRTDGPRMTAAAEAPILMSDWYALQERVEGFLAGGGDPGDLEDELGAADYARWEANKAKLAKGCWVLDDTDAADNGGGWAYWSRPLAPDTATNCLLEEVVLLKDADDDWIYRIDVKLQAVTLGDVGKWDSDGWKTTDAAKSLISVWIHA